MHWSKIVPKTDARCLSVFKLPAWYDLAVRRDGPAAQAAAAHQ